MGEGQFLKAVVRASLIRNGARNTHALTRMCVFEYRHMTALSWWPSPACRHVGLPFKLCNTIASFLLTLKLSLRTTQPPPLMSFWNTRDIKSLTPDSSPSVSNEIWVWVVHSCWLPGLSLISRSQTVEVTNLSDLGSEYPQRTAQNPYYTTVEGIYCSNPNAISSPTKIWFFSTLRPAFPIRSYPPLSAAPSPLEVSLHSSANSSYLLNTEKT